MAFGQVLCNPIFFLCFCFFFLMLFFFFFKCYVVRFGYSVECFEPLTLESFPSMTQTKTWWCTDLFLLCSKQQQKNVGYQYILKCMYKQHYSSRFGWSREVLKALSGNFCCCVFLAGKRKVRRNPILYSCHQNIWVGRPHFH